jgi:ketosteroid isomerase-like protein
MRGTIKGFVLLFLCLGVQGQTDLQLMFETERALARAASEHGLKPAYLKFLSDDSIVFVPSATNGKDYWNLQKNPSPARLVRSPLFADIASNGLVGYTTGIWQLFANGKNDPNPSFGQYATVWSRQQDGTYLAVVDIGVRSETPLFAGNIKSPAAIYTRDENKRGWSAADSSMNFLRMSMWGGGLSASYKRYAGEDIRLLREGVPPIMGKKAAVEETKMYRAIGFPKKVALSETADMAYVWNVCEFAENDEGRADGNCLHVWKLRNKKWYIVLGVIAAMPVQTPPKLVPARRGSEE